METVRRVAEDSGTGGERGATEIAQDGGEEGGFSRGGVR